MSIDTNFNLHLLSKEEQAGQLKGEKVVFRKCNNCPHTVWHVAHDNIVYCGCNLYHIHFEGDKRGVCPCTWKIEGKLNDMHHGERLISNGHFSGNNGRMLGNPIGAETVMQEDGNLVIYYKGHPKWASNTSGQGPGPYQLMLLNDGNLIITDGKGTGIWKAHHNGTEHHPCRLVFQDDGNLVLYDAVGAPLWASNTSGQMRD